MGFIHQVFYKILSDLHLKKQSSPQKDNFTDWDIQIKPGKNKTKTKKTNKKRGKGT